MSRERTSQRDPQNTQAWLIGSGIASLSAAVHLIHDGKVPANNIHLLDVHPGTGGAIKSCGDAENGYFLYSGGCLPYFHDRCVEELLSLVPSTENPDKSLLDGIREDEISNPPQKAAVTRLLKQENDGPHRVESESLQIGFRFRFDLIKIMLDSEKDLSGRIEEHLSKEFFDTTFWTLWSTAFALQPWHSILEFRRSLRKHLGDIDNLNNVRAIDRTKYTIYESIIQPITEYLKREGVNFKFGTKVSKLTLDEKAAHPTVTQIVMQDENNEDKVVTTTPDDLVMVTLGSTNSGSEMGSDREAPAAVASDLSGVLGSEWSLWNDLKQHGHGFGDPYSFTNPPPETHTSLETFTVTLQGSDFLRQYEQGTANKPGAGSLLSFIDSNWGLSISVPQQPVCPKQPSDVVVIWGYGLHPDKPGTFVPKTMRQCSGREIFTEVLSHLGFPVDELLPKSTTIPCLMPLATAPLMSRGAEHRPKVIPNKSSNLALLGQYVDIPEDTTLSMEYSVRGAQLAVYSAMGLPKSPPKSRTHLLLNVLDLLGGV
ncbi:hypothetical protein FE257_003807 [Aspergillus nanangensis]|uniref:67 kDa myosin-cross-reactive antigen family protein n=1 Tax=Aspergillus nanangensis TaxID=2582783 RepID=A0AAD4CB91_ASPNN|nr:hypothetical protein FE257_003807 [Aspergillus nanangensis]